MQTMPARRHSTEGRRPHSDNSHLSAASPPYALDVEEEILGAAIVSDEVLSRVVSELESESFFLPSHREVFSVLVEMHGRGDVVDQKTVAHLLEPRQARLSEHPRVLAARLDASVGLPSDALRHISIIREHHARRRALELSSRAFSNGMSFTHVRKLLGEAHQVVSDAEGSRPTDRTLDGAAFVFDGTREAASMWGSEKSALWTEGESLFIVGPSGVGKTTIGQQLTLARIGVIDSVLGFPVAREDRRVLYIAADRPLQVARSFARMVTERDRGALGDRLVVWTGPLPHDLGTKPEYLARLARQHGAGTVVVDSLKDVAMDLSQEEAGSRVNHALQIALADGIEVLALHHQRKRQQGGAKPTKLEDVYGSTWLTAGAGSVLLLWGEAGDPIVELSHLKQPAGEVGPFKVLHDQHTGTSTVLDAVDIYALLRASSKGLTAHEAARRMFDVANPTRNQIEKSRYRLDALVGRSAVYRRDGTSGGRGGGEPTRWFAITGQEQAE